MRRKEFLLLAVSVYFLSCVCLCCDDHCKIYPCFRTAMKAAEDLSVNGRVTCMTSSILFIRAWASVTIVTRKKKRTVLWDPTDLCWPAGVKQRQVNERRSKIHQPTYGSLASSHSYILFYAAQQTTAITSLSRHQTIRIHHEALPLCLLGLGRRPH